MLGTRTTEGFEMLLVQDRAEQGLLAVAFSLFSCVVIALSGCSRHHEPVAGSGTATGESESSARHAGVQALEALLKSTDTIVIESGSRMVLSSDLRQQLVRIVAGSTIREGGLSPGKPTGSIPPPPMPPPAFVLWIIDKTGSPARVNREEAMGVIEAHVESASPFAQAYQPGKEGAFLLESDAWRTLALALEDEGASGKN